MRDPIQLRVKFVLMGKWNIQKNPLVGYKSRSLLLGPNVNFILIIFQFQYIGLTLILRLFVIVQKVSLL